MTKTRILAYLRVRINIRLSKFWLTINNFKHNVSGDDIPSKTFGPLRLAIIN